MYTHDQKQDDYLISLPGSSGDVDSSTHNQRNKQLHHTQHKLFCLIITITGYAEYQNNLHPFLSIWISEI